MYNMYIVQLTTTKYTQCYNEGRGIFAYLDFSKNI